MCVDNFYDDPDYVREYALSLNYQETPGNYPGSRTDFLHVINPNFFNYFCDKLFSLYYDFNKSNVNWIVQTGFQLVPPYGSDKNLIKNTGWIHLDSSTVFAGVIYLNPIVDINCGTSLYKLKNETPPDPISANEIKTQFYKNKIDLNYDKLILEHNESFIETIKFNNVYNRMISFDSQSYHAANNFQTGTDTRLTQVFFVNEVTSDSGTPLERSRSVIFNTK